jgi:uncharacterized 2Fe-2S/4Fe-4S cluster protein (DUF4445 family)
MPKIKIDQFGKELEAKPGENILEVLQREGIDINAYCGGFGYCGKCLIKILKGNVAQPTAQEIKHLKEKISQGYRLACQAQIIEDIEIDIHDSITQKVEVLAESGEAILEELPVKKINIQLKKPSLNQSLSLEEIAENQLPTSPFVRNWTIQALQELSRIENQDEKSFEIGFDEKQIYWTNSDVKKASFLGIAFDIGTTTLACELLDLETGSTLYRAGALNRQASFGADVLSRLRAIQDNQGALSDLQELLLSSMNDLIQEACQKTGNDPNRILSVMVAGNTIMEHIFLGVSPISIGTAPFTPVFCRSYHTSARRLHLVIHPEARVYIFPSVAGYVGGDIVAGIGAHDLENNNSTLFYVDIGTNGEIVLSDQGKIYCCGTAAGPAFEGAQIKHGTRATLGAIHQVEIENSELKIYTIGDVAPRGVCGTGLIDALACLIKGGSIASNGRLQKDNHLLSSRIQAEGKSPYFVLSHDPQIIVTQEDISQLQLAKAALQAGRKVLLHQAKREESDIDQVILAGAFGSFINPESAMTVGIIPRVETVLSVGNASLLGAKKALLSKVFREKVENLAKKAQYVELSARADFQEYFYEALIFEKN